MFFRIRPWTKKKPANFGLERISSLCFTAEDFGKLPMECRRIMCEEGAMELKVGRTVQPLSLWEKLLPDESLRNTVSRAHFLIIRSGANGHGFELQNLSQA